jgi:simple sugar transport system permease protein
VSTTNTINVNGGQQRVSTLRWAGERFLALRWASILLVAIGLSLYFWAAESVFLTEGNLVTVSHFAAATAIIAAGEVMLLVSGEIDLSAGHIYTISPFLMEMAISDYGVPVILAIPLALALCAVIGLVNGFITVRLHVPSFVTTLGMLFFLNGLTLTLSGAFPISIPQEAVGIDRWLGAAPWSQIVWALLIVAFMHVLFTSTRWGLHTIATGGNLLGAAEAGIRVARIKIGNFMLTAVLAGFAGILEAFRIRSISPDAGGEGVMFIAVAAAVIGGTALAGGSGTIIGALLGAVVLAVLRNGFNLQGIDAYTFDLVLGLAILIAMIGNVYLTRVRRAGRI